MSEGDARWGWAPGEREEGPADRSVRNCMFPLPLPTCVRRAEWKQLSRRRCEAGLRDVRSAAASLNWLHGVRYREPARGVTAATRAKLADLHDEVIAHLEYSVLRWGEPGYKFDAQAALAVLLRGKGPYGGPDAQTGPTPFSHDLVALSEDVSKCPTLAEVLPETAMSMLEGYVHKMLRSPQEVKELDAQYGVIKPHIDANLRMKRRVYIRLIKRMLAAGLVKLSLTRRCEVGVFTVGKKNGDQRLVLDCRPANRQFVSPPGVSLLTAEGMGRFEFEAGVTQPLDLLDLPSLAMGITDVKNCFQRIRFGDHGPGSELAEWFAMPAVKAREIGVWELSGAPLAGDTWLWPLFGQHPDGMEVELVLRADV